MFRPVRKLIFLVGVVVAFYAGTQFEQRRAEAECIDLAGTMVHMRCFVAEIPND